MAVSTLFDISDQYRNLSISDDNSERCTHCSEKVENTQFLPCNHAICYRCMAGLVTNGNFACSICADELSVADISPFRHTQLYELFSTQQRQMTQVGRSRTSSLEESVLSLSPNRITSISPSLPSNSSIISTQSHEAAPASRHGASPLASSIMRDTFSLTEPPILPRCSCCYIEEQFPLFCENCSDILCTLCATNHVSSIGMRDHMITRMKKHLITQFSTAKIGSEIQPVGRIGRDEMIPSPLKSFLSREAQKNVSLCGHEFSGSVYYCSCCVSVLCFDCIVRHEAHKVFPLQGSQDIFKDIFKEMISEMDNWIMEVNIGYRKSKDVVDKLSIRGVNVVSELEEHFKKIEDTLHMREKYLKEKILMVEHLKKQTLYEQMKYLNDSKEKLISMQNSLRCSGDAHNVSELLDFHCKFKKELQNLDALASYFQPHEEDILSFQAPITNVCNGLKTLGSLVSMGFAKNSYVFGVNTKTTIIGTACSVSVQSVDHSGEKRTVGGDDINAVMWCQGNSKHLEIQDHGTGIYTIFFSVFDFLPHTIYVTMRNQRIRNAPFTPSVKGMRQYQTLRYPIATYGTEPVNEVSVKRPWGIHCDRDGFIYVSDRSSNCIHIFNPDGSHHHRFGTRGSAPGNLNRPAGITVDINRRVIVADKDNHRIQLFTFDGNFLFSFGSRGNNPGEFFYPWGIDSDYKGKIVVTDTRNHRIQLFDSNGTFLSSLGSSSVVLWREMDNPRGVCFGPDGQIFVTDFNNHQVAIIDKDLNKNTIRNFGKFGEGDGEFNRPQGIMVDQYGNLLVVDTRNHRINVFTLTGLYVCSFGLGDGKKQIMDRPVDVALSPDGFVFLVDFGNDCVRKF